MEPCGEQSGGGQLAARTRWWWREREEWRREGCARGAGPGLPERGGALLHHVDVGGGSPRLRMISWLSHVQTTVFGRISARHEHAELSSFTHDGRRGSPSAPPSLLTSLNLQRSTNQKSVHQAPRLSLTWARERHSRQERAAWAACVPARSSAPRRRGPRPKAWAADT